MEKGLCLNCEHDVKCCFPRTEPVHQCEEFWIVRQRDSAGVVKKAACGRPAQSGATDNEE